MPNSIFQSIKTELSKQIERTVSEASNTVQEEMLAVFKQEVDNFIILFVKDTILPNLINELSFAEHKMDISDPFTREKILTLNGMIKSLKDADLTKSWTFDVKKDLSMELKFIDDFELIFDKIDNGTKYVPQIKFFDKLTNFVNSLLGVGSR